MSNYNTTCPDFCLTAEQVENLAATSQALDRKEMPAQQRHTQMLHALLSPGDVVTLMRTEYYYTIGDTYTTHHVTVKHINNDGTFTSEGGNRFHYHYVDGQFCTPIPGHKFRGTHGDRLTLCIKQRGTKNFFSIIKVEPKTTPAPAATAVAKIATVAAAAVQLALFA